MDFAGLYASAAVMAESRWSLLVPGGDVIGVCHDGDRVLTLIEVGEDLTLAGCTHDNADHARECAESKVARALIATNATLVAGRSVDQALAEELALARFLAS